MGDDVQQADATFTDRFTIYRFKLDHILGRGGSGTVYRGFDPENNRPCAVKVFHESFFSNKAHIRDLAKNIQIYKDYSHQNIVQMWELVTGDEGTCLVMELVDGPDMKWYILNRPWILQERLVIAAQICNGLQYIHDQGIMHHDLKPANILFTRKGLAKLSDYSLSRARFFGFMNTLSDQVTPMYVSPEIIRKERSTPRSDIYSLGVTFYNLFTNGQVPFQVDNLQNLYHCHLHMTPELPRIVYKGCPSNLSELIMQMMAKDPAKRPDSCDQVRIHLADVGKRRI